MIGLSSTAKDSMLGLFAGKTCTLALYAGDDEIVDALYSRQDVRFSPPLGGDVRYVENVDMIRFEGFNSRHLVDHWAVHELNGPMLARYRVQEPVEVSSTMDCKFRPGELRIGLP
jgi:hypothetical protein